MPKLRRWTSISKNSRVQSQNTTKNVQTKEIKLKSKDFALRAAHDRKKAGVFITERKEKVVITEVVPQRKRGIDGSA